MAMQQEPKLEVPAIYKAYVRPSGNLPTKYGQKNSTFTYLHFRILKFPLIFRDLPSGNLT